MNSLRLSSILACVLGTTTAALTHSTLLTEQGFAQVVQLPNLGTFSIQTTVSAPDSGSTYAGSGRYTTGGVARQGSAGASSGLTLANGTSVHATVIDLNELDKMIRSQSGSKPFEPDLAKEKSRVKPHSIGNSEKVDPPPQYAYLMAMSHSTLNEERSIEDARYYLSLASEAKRKSQWGSVEFYYQMAWKSLPESRRNTALAALVKSRDRPQIQLKDSDDASNTGARKPK
ncbi:MAG: hypothetical protein ACK56W_04550 [Pirellula sp.]|jgi:hypothetical protein|nr:hypothetical protein [Pirellula sp.]